MREGPFVACWTSGALSASANWMMSLTVPVVVFELTGSNALVGTVALATNLPSLIGSPLGGAWADRYSKRVVLLSALGAQILLTLGLYLLARADALRVANLLALSLAIGFATSTNLSAYQSLIADIVPPHQIRPAYRLNAIQFNLARAVGPAIAGLVLARWGPSTAFLLNVLAHLPLALVLLLYIRPQPRTRAETAPVGLLRQIGEGVAVVRQAPALRMALLTVTLAALFGMSVQQLAAGLKEVFGVGDLGLGAFVASIGVAAFVTSILSVWLGDRLRESMLVRIGLVVYGLGLLVVAATKIFAVALIGFAITGFAHVLVNVSITTAIQFHVPDAVRGRVTSLQMMGIILSVALGAQLGGLLADGFDLPTVLALYGGVLIGFAGYAHWRLDGLRAID